MNWYSVSMTPFSAVHDEPFSTTFSLVASNDQPLVGSLGISMRAPLASWAVTAPQVGRPSVASSRNLGLGSVRVFMYVTAAEMAAVVGVWLVGWFPANAAWMRWPDMGATGTMGVELTAHMSSLAKKIIPQLT